MIASFLDFYKGKTVLLTGHTGFKGSWLSLWLQHLGANVIGYALKPPTVPNLFDLCQIGDMVTSFTGDVRDYDHLQAVIKKYQPEIVFHMAAQSLVRRSYHDPLETYSTNGMGTVHLLEAVRQNPTVKALVNITSDKCYENREWCWGYREGDALGGSDPYSSSKGCSELITNAYLKSFFPADRYSEHGAAIATARAGNVIGGGDWAEDRLIPDFIKAMMAEKPIIIRSPHAVRPWQHVLEPLSGYLLLAQKLYQQGAGFVGAWNFGPGEDDIKTVKWMVQYISSLWGREDSWEIDESPHPNETNFLKLDCSKARQELGWYPQWNLQLALEKTVEWYKAYCNREDMLRICLEQIIAYEKRLEQKEG